MDRGVKRGLPLLQNITKRALAVVVFCYNHCGEKVYRERKYTIGETGETTGERKEKTEREYSKTYTKKMHIIRRNKQRDNLFRRNHAEEIDKNLTKCYNIYNR